MLHAFNTEISKGHKGRIAKKEHQLRYPKALKDKGSHVQRATSEFRGVTHRHDGQCRSGRWV